MVPDYSVSNGHKIEFNAIRIWIAYKLEITYTLSGAVRCLNQDLELLLFSR